MDFHTTAPFHQKCFTRQNSSQIPYGTRSNSFAYLFLYCKCFFFVYLPPHLLIHSIGALPKKRPPSSGIIISVSHPKRKETNDDTIFFSSSSSAANLLGHATMQQRQNTEAVAVFALPPLPLMIPLYHHRRHRARFLGTCTSFPSKEMRENKCFFFFFEIACRKRRAVFCPAPLP